MSSVTLYRLSYQKRKSLHFYTLPAILCALVFTTLALAPPVYADDRPGGNVNDPVVRAVDIAKPAVVRIITRISGRLLVDFQDANTGNVVQVGFPRGTGKVYQATLSGSGTFISPNGDILTADHVVNPPSEVLHELAAQDVADFLNQSSQNPNGAVTPQQVFEALVTGQIKSTAEYDTKESEVFFSTHYSGPLTANNLNGIPGELHATVDQIKKSSAFDEKDLAIIHVPLTDTPSVLLGDSSKVEQQDELTIIGFPGNADVSDEPTDLLTSSVNKIIVSSIKTKNGADLIQVGGNVEQGNSGGPALDSEGRVVGVVSFGIVRTPGNTSFLQTSNNALEMIKELNLDTKQGKFQQLWSEAFTQYASDEPGHWRKADQLFKQLTQAYPLFKGAKVYTDYTSEQAKTEKLPVTPTPQPQNTSPVAFLTSGNGPVIAIAGGSVVVVVLITIVAFSAASRRRKKKAAQAVPMQSAAGGMMMSPPAQGPQMGQMPVGGPPMAGRSFSGTSTIPPGMNQPGGSYDNSMSAFGAPSRPMGPQQTFPGTPPATLPGGMPQRTLPNTPGTPIGPRPGSGSGDMLTTTMTLRAWPCGHMNRPEARFCSICGEPQPQGRRMEQ